MKPTPLTLDTDFSLFIKAIGRGKKAGRYLTQTEAKCAMQKIISGQVQPEQLGAFLMLLRVREESPDELAGFVEALRGTCSEQISDLNADLDMGCYAGKRRHLPWFILSVLLLAQQGKRIFLHGTSEPQSKRLYLKSAFNDLDIPVASDGETASLHMQQHGFAYMDLSNVNKPLDDMIQLRALFSLRSCANTLARMLNPSGAEFSLQGVYHTHVDEKHQQASSLLQDANSLCFRGEGGEIELNPERPVNLLINRHSDMSRIELPALNDKWAFKPKSLDVNRLPDLWTGKSSDTYGEQAVIGTLATMLVLMESYTWQTAYQRASQLWEKRNKRWPFSA